MAAVIVEILAQGRGQPQYRRIRQFPYTIGRAYDNDLILPDPAVSAHHLRVETDEQGQLQVLNLSRENGTAVSSKNPASSKTVGDSPHAVTLPCQLQLGHTTLRLLDPQTAVAPASKVHALPLANSFSYAPVSLFLFLITALVVLFLNIQSQVEQETWYETLARDMFFVTIPLGVAVITSFINRVLLHQWRFWLQLSIASLCVLVIMLGDEIYDWADYYFSSEIIGLIFITAWWLVPVAGMLALQLRAISAVTRLSAWASSVLVCTLILLYPWADAVLLVPDFRDQPDMHDSLYFRNVHYQPSLKLTPYLELVSGELQVALEQERQRIQEDDDL